MKKLLKDCQDCHAYCCNDCSPSSSLCYVCLDNQKNKVDQMDLDSEIQKRQRGRPRKQQTVSSYILN